MNRHPQMNRVEMRIPPGVKMVKFPVLRNGVFVTCDVPVDPQEPTFHFCDAHDLMIVPAR